MSGTTACDTPVSPDETRRRGALVLRTLPIFLLPVVPFLITGFIFFITVGQPWTDPAPPPGAPLVALIQITVIVVFFSALIILVRLGRPRLSAVLLIAAWTMLTTLGALQGGATSYLPALLLVPICAAGLLIDRVASVSLAALATLLVAVFAWVEQHGYLPPKTAPAPVIQFLETNAPYLALSFWAALFWTVAALTSLLAGGLQKSLIQSRMQAQQLTELSTQLEQRVAAQTAQLLMQAREAATLEERTRLARDIHDTLAQGLTGIVVQLGAAQRAFITAPNETEAHLDLAQRMAREALAEARRSVWNLRAPALERGDLADALRSLTTHPINAAIRTSFECRGEPLELPLEIESALLRVAQEALVNVAKHGRADQVNVMLHYKHDQVQLTIHDNGVGFDQHTLQAQSRGAHPWGGFGLLGMRERLQALNGTLTIDNMNGARVIASVPLTIQAIRLDRANAVPQAVVS